MMDSLTHEALRNYESQLVQNSLKFLRRGSVENPQERGLYEDAIKIGRIQERIEIELKNKRER